MVPVGHLPLFALVIFFRPSSQLPNSEKVVQAICESVKWTEDRADRRKHTQTVRRRKEKIISYMMEMIPSTNLLFASSYYKYPFINISLSTLHSSVFASTNIHNATSVVVLTALQTSVHDQEVPLPWWHRYENTHI